MAASEETTPLEKTVRFLVSENRNSDLSEEDRSENQRRKRYGKILSALYPLGFFGGLFYCFMALWKREELSLLRGMVVEDHASRVIRNALRRVLGNGYEAELRTARTVRRRGFAALAASIPLLRSVYRSAGIAHVTEYVRVFRLFYFYLMWKGRFKAEPPAAVLLARTNDQKRLALGALAQEYSVPLIAFTVDRVALRRPVPFAVHSLLCWTRRQVLEAGKNGLSAGRMPVPAIAPMKLPVPEALGCSCGLLLNAKCKPDALAEWLGEASALHALPPLQVRPHPGFPVERLSGLPNAEICNWRQPLDAYLDGLDLVFALNTNAIIDALLHGVPVVYVGGMDPYEYDLHRYVADGIAFPWKASASLSREVSAFYSDKAFREKWNPEEFTTDPAEERAILEHITGSAG